MGTYSKTAFEIKINAFKNTENQLVAKCFGLSFLPYKMSFELGHFRVLFQIQQPMRSRAWGIREIVIEHLFCSHVMEPLNHAAFITSRETKVQRG